MRLDIDNDGTVSIDDTKQSMIQLYEFLKNFDVIEKTTDIKSKLYTDAIKYMQNELDEDKKAREARQAEKKENEAKVVDENGESSDIKKTQ